MEEIKFEMDRLDRFLEKYKDVCNETLLKSIWDFGNTQWTKGFNKGKYNPDLDGYDDDED